MHLHLALSSMAPPDRVERSCECTVAVVQGFAISLSLHVEGRHRLIPPTAVRVRTITH